MSSPPLDSGLAVVLTRSTQGRGGPAPGAEAAPSRVCPPRLLVRQQVVDEMDCYRALTHRRGHALNGCMAHIPGRKHPRHARLERKRPALEWPSVIGRKVLAGVEEPVSVARDLVGQPVAVRASPDQHEERVCGDGLLVAGSG